MRKITLVVTVDSRGGVIYNGRRQSRDRLLIKDLCESTNGRIFISEYSLALFKGYEDRVVVSRDPLEECGDGETCFIEGASFFNHLDSIGRIIMYDWGEPYPFDRRLELYSLIKGKEPIEEYEFEGYSHKKITKGIYLI